MDVVELLGRRPAGEALKDGTYLAARFSDPSCWSVLSLRESKADASAPALVRFGLERAWLDEIDVDLRGMRRPEQGSLRFDGVLFGGSEAQVFACGGTVPEVAVRVELRGRDRVLATADVEWRRLFTIACAFRYEEELRPPYRLHAVDAAGADLASELVTLLDC